MVSGSTFLGHRVLKMKATAPCSHDPKASIGWSRPLIDAINSIEESSALGSLGRMMLYSFRHSSIAAAATTVESGKVSTRAASEK
jgi:hypothetical protein